MKYAVIVWTTKDEMNPGTGVVYGWYQTCKEAVEKATNLVRDGMFYQAIALKAL